MGADSPSASWTPPPNEVRPRFEASADQGEEPPAPVRLPQRGLAMEPPPDADGSVQKKTQVDAFIAEFVGSATWQATLAVLEGAFPGLGMASLSGRTGEVWQAIGGLDRASARKLGLPVWADQAGMVFDLSAHRGSGAAPQAGRPRATRPYAGAFVIDTLDPLRYHRARGGPQGPGESPREVRAPEEDDTGVVIVADLTAAGVRVLDSVALWRFAGRVVTRALHDPMRPETRVRARRALRALRRVVFVDPGLGLGLCLQIDVSRTPRCLLAFGLDRTEVAAPRFVRL
ncbi:hypothetical protein ACIBF1_23160 [Spirillospora sp. NPDC050679]